MAEYRVYFIGSDGAITGRVDIVCNDDEEAKRVAKQMVDEHAIELWQNSRRIEMFLPDDPPA